MSASVGNRRWGIILLLILDYIIMFLARSCMSMAGPSLMQEFGWSALQFGWVQTAFFIGYAVTMMPAGALADKFGAGRVLVVGSIWYAIFTFLTPFGSSLTAIMLIRILVGIGQGVVVPSDFSMMSRWFPRKEAGTASGLIQFGCPFGIGSSLIITVMIIQNYGWRTVFYVFAILPLIWCLIWWKFGNSRPEDDDRISKEELAYIKAGQVDPAAEENGAAVPITTKDILSTPSIWAVAISYFCSNYMFFLFMTWLPSYFALGRGVDLKSSAIFSMFPYVLGLIAYPLGGILADKASAKYGNNIGRKIFVVTGLFVAGVFLIIASKAQTVEMAAGMICVSNFFISLTMGSYFSIPVVFSGKKTGTIVGLNGIFGTSSGILAPVLSGAIISIVGSYDVALYVGSGIAIFGACVTLLAKIKPIEAKVRA